MKKTVLIYEGVEQPFLQMGKRAKKTEIHYDEGGARGDMSVEKKRVETEVSWDDIPGAVREMVIKLNLQKATLEFP